MLYGIVDVHFFFFFFFFFPPLLSGLYLWNRYTQRLQIQCAAWSCGLILHCCLPSNLLYFFFFFFYFAKILSGPYLWNRYSFIFAVISLRRIMISSSETNEHICNLHSPPFKQTMMLVFAVMMDK